MTLREAIEQYIAWQRARGARFLGSAYALSRFARSVGDEAACDSVSPDQAAAFLGRNGPGKALEVFEHYALAGFYRYAVPRGLATGSPLPTRPPRRPPAAPPYIYSSDELRRLLAATEATRARATQLQAPTLRALLILLRGTGLRRSEAFRLQLAEVDCPGALLTVRKSKFFKTRLVPLARPIARALQDYADRHRAAAAPEAPFLANRDGTPLKRSTVHEAFAELRRAAGVRRDDGATYQPRLHDLRHTFAVDRLTAWYREGRDVQALLPQLSTYLGHASVAATQVYLRMTPALLSEASARFERYALGGRGGGHD